MKLKIKTLEAIDIGPLRKMVANFIDEMGMKYPNFDAEEVDRMMMFLLMNLNNPDHIFLVALDGKKVVGFFLGYIGQHDWGKPRRIAVAQELYVVPGKRNGFVGFKLIKEAVTRAMTKGVESFECVGAYGITDKRWERFGFTPHLTYGHMSVENMMKLIGDKSENHKEDRYKD